MSGKRFPRVDRRPLGRIVDIWKRFALVLAYMKRRGRSGGRPFAPDTTQMRWRLDGMVRTVPYSDRRSVVFVTAVLLAFVVLGGASGYVIRAIRVPVASSTFCVAGDRP